MKFDRWFWTDDTPTWNKNAVRFLVISTVVVLAVVGWMLMR